MKRWILGLILLGAVSTAGPGHAVTVEDVIALNRADASDALILSKIEEDGTVFHLTVDEILALKERGVSDAVITYMINTGKGDTYPEAEQVVEEAEPYQEYEEDEDYAEEAYQTGLDDRYRGSVDVSFGYYYPHWPGYSYSYYYDPFWWPSLAYYFAYWQPYPYYYQYYNPWYYCNSYLYGYYDHHYGGRYYHHNRYYADRNYDGHRDRHYKGRNVGSRDGGDDRSRSYKDPGDRRTPRVEPTRRNLKPSDPGVKTVVTKRPERPRTLRQPRATKPPAQVNRPGEDRRRVRTGPAPTRVKKKVSDPAPRPSSRRQVKSRPAQVKTTKARPAPARVKKAPPSKKKSSVRAKAPRSSRVKSPSRQASPRSVDKGRSSGSRRSGSATTKSNTGRKRKP